MNKDDRPLKDLKKKLAHEREMEHLSAVLDNKQPLATVPQPGSPQDAAEELRQVMKLPAAESAVFKFAHADKLSEKIVEHMASGDPELEMHAMDISAKLISSVVKAQKGMQQPVIINNQINTGKVRIAGTPGNLKRPRPAHLIDASASSSALPDQAPRLLESSIRSAVPVETPSASSDSSEASAPRTSEPPARAVS